MGVSVKVCQIRCRIVDQLKNIGTVRDACEPQIAQGWRHLSPNASVSSRYEAAMMLPKENAQLSPTTTDTAPHEDAVGLKGTAETLSNKKRKAGHPAEGTWSSDLQVGHACGDVLSSFTLMLSCRATAMHTG